MSRLAPDDPRPDDIVLRADQYIAYPSTPLGRWGRVLAVPLSVTRRHANPLHYFYGAVAGILATDRLLQEVELHVDGDDWPARWRYLVVYVQRHRIYGRVLFEEDGLGGRMLSAPYALPLSADDKAGAAAVYAKNKQSLASISVAGLADAAEFPLCLLPGWTRGGSAITGPAREQAAQLARLEARFGRRECSLPDRFMSGQWRDYATFRWPYAHALITDAVLGLHALCLPAYVLLWIIDWLPPTQLWTEYRKIGLIHGLLESIRRPRPRVEPNFDWPNK